MNGVVLSPPAVVATIDAATGYALVDNPLALTAPPPHDAAGTPLTIEDIARATYSFGALLYRLNADGSIEVFDGTQWQREADFPAFAAAAAVAAYAFDPKTGAWTATFVMATVSCIAKPGSLTDARTGRPRYGFISVFRTPRLQAPQRSARGALFAVASSSVNQRVAVGPVKGLDPAQDPRSADGFAVLVKDAQGFLAAELLLSSDPSQAETVVLRYAQGGVARASVGLHTDGTLHVYSAARVRIEAPVVEVTGELRARAVRYVSAAGTEHQL